MPAVPLPVELELHAETHRVAAMRTATRKILFGRGVKTAASLSAYTAPRRPTDEARGDRSHSFLLRCGPGWPANRVNRRAAEVGRVGSSTTDAASRIAAGPGRG